jgi:hypothetical protein
LIVSSLERLARTLMTLQDEGFWKGKYQDPNHMYDASACPAASFQRLLGKVE